MGRARAWTAAAGLLLGGAALPVLAAISGGGYTLTSSGMSSGGGTVMTGGGVTAVGAMGGASVTSMSGGGYSVATGVLSGNRVAAETLDAAHAYPIPFIPSRGDLRITFTRLEARVTIKVYDIAGELVKTLTKDDGMTDSLAWSPVVNDRGESLASGVYIYHIYSSDGKSVLGKLMVIK
ncbi:MAG: T9SS type A sorting domain-containing protein [Elusimicrobia bacterium]|nr:T9SS type A sorting domain-containing protein [Elusimicrobiota bacterium]